jgi:peroxiredoxin Q/BCP
MSWFSSNPLAPGTPAPDFTLNDQNGDPVQLSALRGRNVVLVFYPGDHTPQCRVQLGQLRDRWEDAKQRNLLVFGVNPAGQTSHALFHRRNKLPFPLLIDRGRKVATAFQANGLFVKRTVYVVGPDGVILYGQRGKPPVSEIFAAAS